MLYTEEETFYKEKENLIWIKKTHPYNGTGVIQRRVN
jgi:hypothetical protein